MLARTMNLVKLDGTKVKASASKHKALSYGHLKKIEVQLQDEVKGLTARAEAADRDPVPDGLDVPAELARREARLAELAEARATLEARARERFAAEQQTFEERQAQRKAGKDPQPPSAAQDRGTRTRSI